MSSSRKSTPAQAPAKTGSKDAPRPAASNGLKLLVPECPTDAQRVVPGLH